MKYAERKTLWIFINIHNLNENYDIEELIVYSTRLQKNKLKIRDDLFEK